MQGKKMQSRNRGPLGDFDLDESPGALPIAEQIISKITANAGKVLDLFRSWDADGDGVITRREFHKAMYALGLKVPKGVIDSIFTGWDRDGGGEITLVELQKVLRVAGLTTNNIARLKRMVEKKLYRINEMFHRMDEDNSGDVSKDEFRMAVRNLNSFEHTPIDQIDAMFDAFDVDCDNAVTFVELNKFLRRDVTAEENARKAREEERRLRELANRVHPVDVSSLRAAVAKKVFDDVGWLPRSEAKSRPEQSAVHEETGAEDFAAQHGHGHHSPEVEVRQHAGSFSFSPSKRPDSRSLSPELPPLASSPMNRAREREFLHLNLRLRGTELPQQGRRLLMPSISAPSLSGYPSLPTADSMHSFYRSTSRCVTRHGQRHPFDAASDSSARLVLGDAPIRLIDVLSVHRVRSFQPARRNARVLLPCKSGGLELREARRKVHNASCAMLSATLRASLEQEQYKHA
jgi:Ca2+-binding EF-hand superfamily protein